MSPIYMFLVSIGATYIILQNLAFNVIVFAFVFTQQQTICPTTGLEINFFTHRKFAAQICPIDILWWKDVYVFILLCNFHRIFVLNITLDHHVIQGWSLRINMKLSSHSLATI